MKIKVERNQLLEGLEKVGRFVSRKPISDILKGVYIKASDSSLEFAGTDLTTYGRTILNEVDVQEEGEALIPFKLVNDVVRKLPVGEEVTVEKVEDDIRFKAGSFNFKCRNIAIDDYSTFIGPEINQEPLAVIPAEDFIRSVDAVKDSIAGKDAIKPILASILIERKNNFVNFVALDGFRVSWAKIKSEGEDFSIAIDGEVLHDIIKAIDKKENVEIYANENIAMLKQKNILCKTPLQSGQFFDYKTLIDKAPKDTKIEVLKEDLIAAIDRATVVVNDKNNLIVINVTDDEIIVKANTEITELEDKVLVNKTGNDLTIGFNAEFLLDALKYQKEKVVIRGSGDVNAWILQGEDDDFLTEFVLPIKLQSVESQKSKAS